MCQPGFGVQCCKLPLSPEVGGEYDSWELRRSLFQALLRVFFVVSLHASPLLAKQGSLGNFFLARRPRCSQTRGCHNLRVRKSACVLLCALLLGFCPSKGMRPSACPGAVIAFRRRCADHFHGKQAAVRSRLRGASVSHPPGFQCGVELKSFFKSFSEHGPAECSSRLASDLSEIAGS